MDHPDLMERYPTPPWNMVLRATRARVHLPYPSGGISYGKPQKNLRAAIQDGERGARAWEDKNFPGGMASLVAILKWDDSIARSMGDDAEDEFQAVINTYYSGA